MEEETRERVYAFRETASRVFGYTKCIAGSFDFFGLGLLFLVTGTTSAGKMSIGIAKGAWETTRCCLHFLLLISLIVIYIAESELQCSIHSIMMRFANAVVQFHQYIV